MGCLKITYNQEVRRLGENHFFLGKALEKSDPVEKNCIDYYPFGSVATHWEKEPYRFGYQGQFAEEDEETGFNHFEAREYDPVIGRWMVPDPARQYASPYNGMGNNPINGVDPDGRERVGGALGWQRDHGQFSGMQAPGFFAGLGDAALSWIPGWDFSEYAAASFDNGDYGMTALNLAAGVGEMAMWAPSRFANVLRSAGSELMSLFSSKSITMYRSMTDDAAAAFLKTGVMPAGTETFVSFSKSYASKYSGTTFEIVLKPSVITQLESIGVRNAAKIHPYGHLPLVDGGWKSANAFFKVEKQFMNIGLGNGKALNIFNKNIKYFNKIQ